MANTIKVKRSAVAAKVPTTTDLELGEIAVNTYDGKMYIKKDDGAESVVQIGGGGAGSGDVVGPGSATDNAITRFDGTTGKLIQNSGITIDDNNNSSGTLSQTFADGTAVTVTAGKMWYNDTTGSWNLGMGGGNVTQQVGEELYRYGRASSAITDSPLQLVYKTGGVGASGEITFAPAVSGITDYDLIIGCATENIALNSWGRVTTYGVVRNITTDGSAYSQTWADNDDIYYNPVTGGLTNVEPTAPNIKLFVGTVINAAAGGAGSFIVKLGVGLNLNDISNVEVTSPTGGQLLSYNQTGGYWSNINLTDGTAISITETTGGAITIDNTGVTSLTGTASEIDVSASTGAVTLSLPATINANTTGNAATVTNGVYTTDIGSTVQAYDADTTKNDVANTFTANQTINADLIVDTNTLFVDSVNNNVGIGTSSPHGALSVLGQNRIVTIGSGPTLNTPELKARNTADTGYAFFDISTYRTKFFTEGLERMVIREDGNVGIGTSIPSSKLEVNGTITATAFSGPLTGNVTGDVSGNAGTVTNGVYTTDIGSTVQAYDADTAKLDTTQTWTATQTYGDNVYQQFGTGNDLLIYHNGTDSYIRDNGTGSLVIGATDTLYIKNSANTITAATFTPATSVTLRYNNSTKLETSNTGVTVTGTVAATAYTGDGSALTALNASNLSTGTIPDARISGSYTGMTNLTGSGTVDFAKFLGNAADTVTAPSYSWTGDTNTGIYQPGADQMGFVTAGVSRMNISTGSITNTTLHIGQSSGSTDVNAANDTGSFSVRGSPTTVASMSFHRTGAYAVNMGLGTDNVFRIGGWSAPNNLLQLQGSTGNLTLLGTCTATSFSGSIDTNIIYDTFTATAAQTTFTPSQTYNANKIEVYVNGVKMRNGSDVTVTSGTSVVFASGLTVGDLVDLVYPL